MEKKLLIFMGLIGALNFLGTSVVSAQPKETEEENQKAKLDVQKNELLSAANEYIQKAQYKNAIEIYQKYLASFPKDQAVQVDYIKALLWKGDYDVAQTQLTLYKNQYGEDAAYWTEEARRQALMGGLQKALEQINQIEKKFSSNPNLENIKAYVNTQLKQTQKSASASKDKSLEEGEYEKFQDEASKAVNEKLYSNAIKLYEDYLLKYPNNKDAKINLIKINLWAGNYPVAQKQLDGYRQKFGEDLAYQTEYARYLAFTGKYNEALQYIDQLKVDTNNKDLLEIKSYASQLLQKKNIEKPELPLPPQNILVLMKKKNEAYQKIQAEASKAVNAKLYSNAIKLYEDYLLKYPNNKDAKINLIKINLWAGNYPVAQTQLDGYRQKFGEDLAYQTERARYLTLSGKVAEALQYIRQIKVKEPNKDLSEIKSYAEQLLHKKTETVNKASPKKNDPASLYKEARKTEEGAERKKTDPSLYLLASQQYSMVNKPSDALRMIQQAIRLSPANIEYLKSQAEIANWLNDQPLVYESYHKILLLEPNNPAATLGVARYYGLKSYYYLSIKFYAKYLKFCPEDSRAWIEYAYIQTWCSNYVAALHILDQYVQRFGMDFEFLKAKARILAAAQRPLAALKINNPLLEKHPKDLGLLNTQALAFYYNRQPNEMFKILDEINQLQKPDENLDALNRFLKTPYRSNIGGDFYHTEDTDSVRINRLPLSEEFFLTHKTRFIWSGYVEHIQADIDSGLNPIQGGMGLDVKNAMMGMRHRINEKLELEGKAGSTESSLGGSISAYYAAAKLNPSDILAFTVSQARDYYDVSARAVSLGITRNFTQLNLAFTPILQQGFYLNGGYGSYSDSNQERRWVAAYKFGVLRVEKFSMDLGIFGLWDKFAERLSNGYYDPLNYHYYAGTLDASISFNQDTAVLFSFGLGKQRDETFLRAKPASDAAVKALFGITKNIMVTVTMGVSTRGRSIGTASLVNSNYRVSLVDVGLVIRL